MHSGSHCNQQSRTTGRTVFPKKPTKACPHPADGVCDTRCWTSEAWSELPVLWSARCPRPKGRPGGRSSVTGLTESVLAGMLAGRQSRGWSAPTPKWCGNPAGMGMAMDPNKAVPLRQREGHGGGPRERATGARMETLCAK